MENVKVIAKYVMVSLIEKLLFVIQIMISRAVGITLTDGTTSR